MGLPRRSPRHDPRSFPLLPLTACASDGPVPWRHGSTGRPPAGGIAGEAPIVPFRFEEFLPHRSVEAIRDATNGVASRCGMEHEIRNDSNAGRLPVLQRLGVNDRCRLSMQHCGCGGRARRDGPASGGGRCGGARPDGPSARQLGRPVQRGDVAPCLEVTATRCGSLHTARHAHLVGERCSCALS